MKGFNKALFLDLDGTIIRVKSGSEFPKDIDDWEIIEGILPTIKRYSEEGYLICIVTNQGGIELGYITEEDIKTKLDNITKEIETYIRKAINVAYCKFMDSYYRKPKPGMAYHFAINLELDLSRSIMVGDSISDNHFANSAGIGAYLTVNQFIGND